uniref:Uncharacterized protein n=1 Tax=Brassica oleracea var. oleracea TaxID=109376 RepID=A0A0D3CBB8_BRAOL
MSLDVNMTSNVGLQGSLDSVVISWAYGFINYSTSTSSVGHTVLSITQPRPLEAVNLRKVNKVRGHWSARNSA